MTQKEIDAYKAKIDEAFNLGDYRRVKKLVGTVQEIAFKTTEERLRESLPMRRFMFSRNRDAFVVHHCEIEARTEGEAWEKFREHGNEDVHFDLEQEGDVVAFDDVTYALDDSEVI